MTAPDTNSKYQRNNYLHVWLPDPELKKKIRVAAANADVSISDWVRQVLEKALP